ncbi:conserved hypothetical protein [Neospora caninum Liverpool]|uniref:Uncharacterized protein n=1 Tax=Neospora caninum (strain Liverpool) TaxID=572307 RepID=F0VG29_NEOCL|nr:conserved hypothetical protein [Neospora caninum Liverpool]CBZ52673.1 conserved hypothetical protein [Neospora caninum Liverpool]CEL66650.1 TPA: hypothetical protein BN1204_024610 [Neospora caninum Liverpool]|eukprot:XP_003882705.1 conserved hypothetical protein [Neospora caninum Liverpool]
MTTSAGNASMSMESRLNCSLDDLVKMQRQAAAQGRNSQRKNPFRRGNGPKLSGRGRAINKRGGPSTGGADSGRTGGQAAGNVRGAVRRGRGGRGGFAVSSRNRPTPKPGAKKKQNLQAATPKVSLAQRLAQPLENSVPGRKAGKPGPKKTGTANARRVATAPVSAQRMMIRPGMRLRGRAASRKSRLPLGLPRTRDGALVGRPAARLAVRSTAGARLQGLGAANATRGRKAVTVRKTGGISKLANATRAEPAAAAARLKAARPGAARPLNTSFNRRAQSSAAGGFASAAAPRPTRAATAGSTRRRAPAPGNRVPVLRGSSAQQPVQRAVPSASDLELMSKIKIMATLDKVPPPMAAQRGMAVTPPQAMVDEHGYANNKSAQAAHLPYNGYGGGSLSDRFSKYGPR